MSVCNLVCRYCSAILPKSKIEATLAAGAIITGVFCSSGAGVALGACYATLKGSPYLFARKVLGYKPAIPSGPISAEERGIIGKISNVVAVVKVKNIVSGKWETAYITVGEKGEWGQEKFYLFNMNGESLGWAEAIPLKLTDPEYQSSWMGGPPKQYIGYGSDPTKSDKVLLESLFTKDDDIQDRYKYSGYLLFKTIYDRYKVEFRGKMILDAGYNSHAFYYKLGFRAVDPVKNAKIEEAIALAKGKEPKTSKLGTVLMYFAGV